MQNRPFLALVFLIVMNQPAVGQDTKTVIPFELTAYNNIAIPAVINEKDTVRLMFHTAATDVTLTKEATAKLKSIAFDKTIDGIKSWGGQNGSGRQSDNNSLAIAGLTWTGISITENILTGRNTDGKCGMDLFKGKVVQIDFEKQEITLTQTLPRRLRKYQKLTLSNQQDMHFIEANCEVGGQRFTNKFLIHSGYSGSVLLDDQFANDNQLGDRLKIIGEKELKDSYGNILKTKKAILPSLHIGNQPLADVPVGFFTGSLGRQKISALGGDILKRFTIVIDAERKFIYLKANKLMGLPYATA